MNAKRRVAGLFVVSCLVVPAIFSRSLWARHAAPAGGELKHAFETGIDSLVSSLAVLDTSLVTGNIDEMRRAFRHARTSYKHEESLLNFYSPSTISVLNGPLENEDDEAPPRPLGQPSAFQRLEQRLFASRSLTESDRLAARADVKWMLEAVSHFRSLTGTISVSTTQVLDAARTELARVSTLGIAGVDSDESGDAIRESAEALEGIDSSLRIALASATSAALRGHLTDSRTAIRSAVSRLRSDANVTTMNRIAFVAVNVREMGTVLLRAREAIAPLNMSLRSVWRPTAATPFERDALDAAAYAPDFALPATKNVVALGEMLFNDPRLSGPATRSCASCHMPSHAFADNLPTQMSVSGHQHVARNTPTLLNAALQPTLFNDSRALSLEAQVGAVLSSELEMASSPEIAANRLSKDAKYVSMFEHVAPSPTGSAISPLKLRAVLAAYVRSLQALDSRFDRAAHGDTLAMTRSERQGFTVFWGKAGCGTCHFAPLFSGVMPPSFMASEPAIIGVPIRPDTARASLDTDEGRGAFDGIREHRNAFKVPTLRNVERTAPYMHNGVFATLEQVVDFLHRGGGEGIGIRNAAQTLSSRPLQLTQTEQQDLIAFLKSLTDLRPAAK